jgi:hypothetical protein
MQAYSVVFYRFGTAERTEDTFPSRVDAGVYADMLNRALGLPASSKTFYKVIPKYHA